MRLFEAFKNKWIPQHESSTSQAEQMSNDIPQGEAPSKFCISGPNERLATLTPREYDLFLFLLEGYTLKEAAKQMSVKYSTANTHMTGIYKKLHVNSRAELIIQYRDTVKTKDEIQQAKHRTPIKKN